MKKVVAVAWLTVTAAMLPSSVQAEDFTFLLGADQVFASYESFNAFLAGKAPMLRGVKAIPGGIRYARQRCLLPDGGQNLALAEVVVLDSLDSIKAELGRGNRKAAERIQQAMVLAGVDGWVPPAKAADANWALWIADATWETSPYLPRYQSQGFIDGSSQGFLTQGLADKVFRFTVDINPALADPYSGLFRFMLKLTSQGSITARRGKVKIKRNVCLTFVDLRPVDLQALAALIGSLGIPDPPATLLHRKIERIETQLGRGNLDTALDILAEFIAVVGANTGSRLTVKQGRILADAAFNARRGLTFVPQAAVCSNGQREIGEACDQGDLGGATCQSAGFHSGPLSCNADCTLNTTACLPMPVCGNGVVEVGEECDDGAGNSNREPDACRTDCREAFCGDGVVDGLEDCDGRDLDGSNCREEGWDGGQLRCDEDCFFDEDKCFDRDF